MSDFDGNLCQIQVLEKIRNYIADINANPSALARGQHGPWSKYELPEEGLKGRLDLKFFDNIGKGVACNLESQGRAPLVFIFVFNGEPQTLHLWRVLMWYTYC